jgi:low temperature requirement protein LtrA
VSPDTTKGRIKRWLSSPPRPHGEAVTDRTVSFLELFYDLAYVAVIAQAAHHLAQNPSLQGFGEFAVVFWMIWIAWMNGSLYIELHGREDGRTRLLVFGQMAVLALLAVFTGEAAGETGDSFALVYAAFLLLATWQWFSVRQEDRTARPEYLAVTGWYVVGMALSALVVAASAFLSSDARLLMWAGLNVGWIIAIQAAASIPDVGISEALPPTDSLVERFGLFTIIVLGEVVFGVVSGLSATGHDLVTIATGLVALLVGFGLWWIYFDLVGRRLPRADRGNITIWMLSHIPLTMAIAAVGAGMVSLIGHAHDPATPPDTAWLLAGSTAIGLLALIVTERSLVDARRLAVVYRPLSFLLTVGAAAAAAVGWLAPAPWLLALLLLAILLVLWLFAVAWMIRAGAWGGAPSPAAEGE